VNRAAPQDARGPLSRGPLSRGPLTALAAAGTTRAAYVLLKSRPPGGEEVWHRTNHRGEPVTLLEGPAAAAGAVMTVAIAPGVPARARAAAALAGAGAAAFGGYDDLAGSGDRRGFRGHLGALRQGNVTTGAVKIGGIGATGAAAAAILGGPPVDMAINAGLVAGSANLLNLFDLRPGRAIKVALAAAALLRAPVVPAAASAAGSAVALIGEDLGERAMLGDAGANALGAVLGAAAAASLPRGARLAVLAGITGLTAASEVVSFTKVIERTAPLRWLDMMGRRAPSHPSAQPAAEPPARAAEPPARAAEPPARAAEPPAHAAEPPAHGAEPPARAAAQAAWPTGAPAAGTSSRVPAGPDGHAGSVDPAGATGIAGRSAVPARGATVLPVDPDFGGPDPPADGEVPASVGSALGGESPRTPEGMPGSSIET
jgi:UDP-GlcNAc:undecaprenyl-phosphate/decaprenyl-phosphate GlcNAc-1-phosphate transferase